MIDGRKAGDHGRVLRYGMVGGGPGSFIGGVHRAAISLEGCGRLVAGCFSSQKKRIARKASSWVWILNGSMQHSATWRLLKQAEMIRYPTLDMGIAGVRFIESCVASSHQGAVWVDVPAD